MLSPGALLLAGVGRIANRAPVPLVTSRARGTYAWLGGRSATRDMDTYMDAYATVGTVFAIVNRLASSVAAVEWKLYRKSASGNPDDREQVMSHAVLDLLERPNPHMSRMELMEAGQQHSDLVGETDIVVGKVAGVKYPLELWPVMPQRLEPVPDPYKLLAGWIYRGPDGQDVPLGVDELIRHRQPNPSDPYRGMGPIQSVLMDLDAARFGKEWQRQFFLNSAQPGGIIQVDRRLSDDEFAEMTMRWREQHQGISKAHRIAVIEQGAQYVDAKITQRDMQFVEADQLNREVIREAFGFPKGMLGTVDDVNRANAEAGEYMYGKWLIEPRLRRWRSMFNRQLLPMFGPDVTAGLELDFECPTPENSEQANAEIAAKSAALVALANAGFEPSEVLEFFGWPELSYEKPEPPQVTVAGMKGPEQGAGQGKRPEDHFRTEPTSSSDVDMAMRWVVETQDDDNECDPCRMNSGRTYRNRADAYADYPDGKGYRLCVGEQYGNSCRCTVVKRRRKT